MVLEYITITLLVIIVLGFGWAHFCNDKTLSQRIDIMIEDFPEGLQKFRKVSYNKHFIYLLTFRNPLKLYK